MAATVVKSKWMVDPNDKFNLIKREEDDSLAIDREYWDRVNQGATVKAAAKQLDSSNTGEEEGRRQPVRVGKLRNRAGFLESLQGGGEEVVCREQVKTGKLNPNDYFCPTEEESDRQHNKVGKLNRPDVGLFTGIVEAVPAIVKPQMKIGKLDPRNVFDTPTEDKENESNRRSSLVIGKINAKNLFENNNEDKLEAQKSPINVGKINTKDIFAESSEFKPVKTDIKVGKLKINEEDLFDTKEETPEKTIVRVGKITKIKFNNNNTDGSEEQAETPKFYKPTVQPKKLKVAELFSGDKETEYCPKEEVKVGKLDTSNFLKQSSSSESSQSSQEVCRVGRLDTSKLFSNTEQEEKEEKTAVVGKLNLGNVFPEKEEVEPKREVIRVGKLRQNIYEARETEKEKTEEVKVGKVRNVFAEVEGDKEAASPVVLRGARRVNKGNRISCLIENLHTDKKPDDSDEETEADKEEEVIQLGRERMARIQNMFSGEKVIEEQGKAPGSTSCTDYDELRDEGLVSSNLQRFATGNLRNTSQEANTRKSSLETNYIDRKHIECVASMFEESGSNQEHNLEKARPRRLRDAEDLFQHKKEDYTDCVRTEVKVGKLNKDVFNPSPESPKEEKTEIKVGKISTKDLFAQAEANSEELLREVRVGKLSQDRLTLSSSTDLDTLERVACDTDVAPSGGVQEKATAFSNTKPKSKSPPRSCPKIKRSESSAADDMQRKYEQQMASTALKRGSSSTSVVVKKENMARKDPVAKNDYDLKVEAKVSRKSSEEELTVGEMLNTPEKPRVEPGKMQEARTNFFSSMMAATATPTTSSVQKLGTSIIPTVSAADRDKFSRIEKEKQSSGGHQTSRGKALFQKMAQQERKEEEEREEEEEERLLPVELLPGVDMEEMRMTVMMRRPEEIMSGVDLEEIEDEFEALHREMMEDGR